jgi:hypothetical protein
MVMPSMPGMGNQLVGVRPSIPVDTAGNPVVGVVGRPFGVFPGAFPGPVAVGYPGYPGGV